MEEQFPVPEGWHLFGRFANEPRVLIFSEATDITGLPLWERPMQRKDIPDEIILGWHQMIREAVGRDYVFIWEFEDHTRLPNHLLLAKLKHMIKRNVMDGCACGCRGDFKVIT